MSMSHNTQYTIHSDVMLSQVNASETLVNKVKVSEWLVNQGCLYLSEHLFHTTVCCNLQDTVGHTLYFTQN